jgi:PhoH-like ATPase
MTESKTPNKKAFVVDTCVYCNDPGAIFSFGEHDIHVPKEVQMELDRNKRSEKPELRKNAQLTARYFRDLIKSVGVNGIKNGIPLSLLNTPPKTGKAPATGRIFFEEILTDDLVSPKYADGHIIHFVKKLQEKLTDTDVIFVTEDIIAYNIAASCGIHVEPHKQNKAIDDIDFLYTGTFELPESFWNDLTMVKSSKKKGEFCYWELETPLAQNWYPNQFLYIPDGNGELEYIVEDVNGETTTIRTITNYRKVKNGVWGWYPQKSEQNNGREQNFLMNALMNPEIKLVTAGGKQGTGKTLAGIAAALAQVNESKRFREILITKEAMPMGQAIGFLPGTEEEKMAPWMGAFTDNLRFLASKVPENQRESAMKLMTRNIRMSSLGMWKGRTIHDTFLMIDEFEDLNVKQAKGLITRVCSETSKVFCLGNVGQIDTPYLTAESSGFTHVIEAFKPYKFAAHVTLVHGERGELADVAADIL